MPWKDGIYHVSMYDKYELPVWAEVYENFYLRKLYVPGEDDGTIDPYWKISKRKYTTYVVCNEFNKMNYEDEYHMYPVLALCTEKPNTDLVPIYTIPMPNGKPNEMIIPNPKCKRFNINDLEFTEFYFMDKDEKITYNGKNERFMYILEEMMKPFRKYFEGDSVGWKDEKGAALRQTGVEKWVPADFDPAL